MHEKVKTIKTCSDMYLYVVSLNTLSHHPISIKKQSMLHEANEKFINFPPIWRRFRSESFDSRKINKLIIKIKKITPMSVI